MIRFRHLQRDDVILSIGSITPANASSLPSFVKAHENVGCETSLGLFANQFSPIRYLSSFEYGEMDKGRSSARSRQERASQANGKDCLE